MKIVKIGLLLLFTPFVLWAEDSVEADENTQFMQQMERQRQIQNLLFTDFPDLNTTFAVRQESGRIFLIIEIDHNLHGNKFTLQLSEAGLKDNGAVEVVRENLPFGMSNKNVVYLPLIEMAVRSPNKQIDLFSLNSSNNRTQQQIDITEILNQAAESNRMVDGQNKAYGTAEIHEVAFAFNSIKENSPRKMEVVRVKIQSMTEGQTQIILGQTPVQKIPLLSLAMRENRFVPKVSVDLLYRYLGPFINELQGERPLTSRQTSLQATLQSMPIDFDKGNLPLIAKKLSQSQSVEELINIIMLEQYKIQSGATRLCKSLFL